MSSTPRKSASILLWLLASGLVAGAASAADKPAKTPASAKPPQSRILTPAQLKDCLDQKARVTAQTDAALKAKAELNADKSEIDRSGTAMSEEVATLDRTSIDAVDAHNAKVDQRNQLIESYQAKVAAYNKQAEAVQASRDTYAGSCEDRRYDDRDLVDLQKKK